MAPARPWRRRTAHRSPSPNWRRRATGSDGSRTTRDRPRLPAGGRAAQRPGRGDRPAGGLGGGDRRAAGAERHGPRIQDVVSGGTRLAPAHVGTSPSGRPPSRRGAAAAGMELTHGPDGYRLTGEQCFASSITPGSPSTPADAAVVLMTSGSTGTPKRVPLTHANLLAGARSVADVLELGPADRALVMWEQYHVGGLVDLSAGALAAAARPCAPAASTPGGSSICSTSSGRPGSRACQPRSVNCWCTPDWPGGCRSRVRSGCCGRWRRRCRRT